MTTSMELIEQITSAFAGDDLIRNWCIQTFGRAHTVYIDIDENNPPKPDVDYPVIAVTGLRQIRGLSIRELSWELDIGVGVVNEEVLSDGNARIMTGFGQAHALREMAENAIYRVGLGDVSSVVESGSVSYYPLFISGSTIPIKILKPNRRAMPG